MKTRKRYSIKNVVGDVFKASPRKFILEYLATLIDGIAVAGLAVTIELIFSAVEGLSDGSLGYERVVLAILIFLGLNLVSEISSGISNYCGEIFCDLNAKTLTGKLNTKLDSFDPIEFEKDDTLDLIEGAYDGAWEARQVVNTIMDIFTLYLPYFVVYGCYLFSLRPLLLLIFPLIILPTLFGQFIKARFYTDAEKIYEPLKRKAKAFESYLGDKEYAKETRILGAVGYFSRGLASVLDSITATAKAVRSKACKVDFFIAFIQLLGYTGIIILLILSVTDGYINIAEFAAVLSSVEMLTELEKELFAERIGELAESLASVKEYITLMNAEASEQGEMTLSSIESIESENISFVYPGTEDEHAAVKDVSLTLRRGQSLALVGENGSGKTTLTKLLAGLYAPSSGRILYNSNDIQSISRQHIFDHTTAVFQNYGRYKLEAGENIAFTSFEDVGNEATASLNETIKKAAHALRDVKLDMELHTMLSREFGGTDLSGGQWQRIAIARGIYHTGDLVVLDEPTAAIDPINEEQLYHCFMEMIRGKIGLIVTHRLGLARCCDRIALMENGILAAIGTHEQLLGSNEYYRNMWNLQAGSYSEFL